MITRRNSPQVAASVQASRLDWTELDRSPHREMLAWYRTLIQLRRDEPELGDPRLDRVSVDFDEDARWLVVHRGRFRVVVNLADTSQQVPLDRPAARVVVSSKRSYPVPAGVELDAETVAVVEV